MSVPIVPLLIVGLPTLAIGLGKKRERSAESGGRVEMKLLDLLFGEFLDRENPFSAAREPRSREMFSYENNRLLHAWSRTITALPVAVLAVLVAGPLYRWAGFEPGTVFILTAMVVVLAFLMIGFWLTTGMAAFWMRHTLMRDANKLRAMEHDLESTLAKGRRER